MKAIVQNGYGQPEKVLSVRDVERPAPKPDEVLVRVHAASLHPDVWHVVTGRPYVLRLMGAGVSTPKARIPGTDLAGVVEAVGAGVSRFQVGDAVFGESITGMQWVHGSTFAEYVAVPEKWVARKPEGITMEEAAAVPTSGIIALRGLRGDGQIEAGQRVLVNGAGGGVGMLAVQIAKAMGTEVTAVDVTAKLNAVRALGADHVIDGVSEDFTRSDARYDIVLDIPGNHPYRAIKRVLTPTGRYVLIGHDAYGREGRRVLGSIPRVFRLLAMAPFSDHIPRVDFSVPDKAEALETLRRLLESGDLRPIVGPMFALEEVHEAFRDLVAGKGLGKILILPMRGPWPDRANA